ncbi:type II toxin-antitoxin system RelE/ParE family toxin [Pseudomonas lundensis]|uniref:type II toxin-antitoxin system RelE/ParE family toxin n=1 Tax=Serratia proteamaculans TaxID=28151 RepID=UPI0029815869|nr:type II toxin-antitoxin system RelE/ParE family toxin [Serratia proteamaculans]MDW5501450.1 type II toxin-antitoxin system RelE/ParE family toxin [Serratia proteamaculans]MDW5506515.1 type II toxin-antitoxin system RelE/ParE family toxin [Pseudomonas lundensis]
MLAIEWSRSARQDLAEILDFVADDNPRAARKMKTLLTAAIVPAAEHPLLFRRGRVDGTREIVVHPHYLLIYQVATDRIKVLRVLHARRQYP